MRKKILFAFALLFSLMFNINNINAEEYAWNCYYYSVDNMELDMFVEIVIYSNQVIKSDHTVMFDTVEEDGCPSTLYTSSTGKISKVKTNDYNIRLSLDMQAQSIMNEDYYNNYSDYDIVSCGGGLITDIPGFIPKVVSIIYIIIQIAIPVVLVIFGMLDLFKGITAQKEDEIKKGQQILIKRIISACLVFFVLVIVKFVISVVASANSEGILDCAECFIRNDCD